MTYCLIHTDLGYRAYAEKELAEIFEIAGLLADGSATANGTNIAGEGLGLLDKAGRVLSFSAFERTVQPRKKDVLLAYSSKQQQHASVDLDNTDRYFSRIIAREPFLSKLFSIYVGFEADPFNEHIQLFEGIISEINITDTTMTIEADER